MFTGLVAAIGTATAVQPGGDAMRIDVDLGDLAGPHRIGDSIALSGVCCTVIELRGNVAGFDLSPETLRRTWLGEARPPATRTEAALWCWSQLHALIRDQQAYRRALARGEVATCGGFAAWLDAEVPLAHRESLGPLLMHLRGPLHGGWNVLSGDLGPRTSERMALAAPPRSIEMFLAIRRYQPKTGMRVSSSLRPITRSGRMGW